jgi:hypothetical protein
LALLLNTGGFMTNDTQARRQGKQRLLNALLEKALDEGLTVAAVKNGQIEVRGAGAAIDITPKFLGNKDD